MTYKNYVITLHRHEDLEEFYHDIEHEGGSLFIPNRRVSVVDRRPISRNTIYALTDQEADLVRNDPRVRAVELHYIEQDLKIEPSWLQTGTFFKGPLAGNNPAVTSTDKNWALLRCTNSYDMSGHGSDNVPRINATISTQHSGKNVDIVIIDGHIRPNHAEFAANVDGTGTSRVNQINWFDYSIALGKSTSATYVYNNLNTDNGNHGATVASIAAGNTQGWARDSYIFNISPYSDNADIDASDVIDYVRYWHQNKPINPNTGRKNPTIINNSWGIYRYINLNDITEIVHRGVSYTGVWNLSGIGSKTYQQLDLGYNGAQQYFLSSGDTNYYIRISHPVAAWQSDAEDAISDGIHVVTAAGNDGLVNDLPSGANYNNIIKTLSNPTGYYYNRKAGVNSEHSITVASIGSNSLFPGIDEYTNRGPAIDVCAPGSGIVGAVNDNSGVPDSRLLNNDHIDVFSGTSFAAPQVTGILASLLEYFVQDTLPWTPATAKFYICQSNVNTNHLFDYPAPRNLRGTPNRYLRYSYITTTTTTSTSTTTTSTSTSSTSTSTSSTSTTQPVIISLAAPLTFPLICLSVPLANRSNVVDEVAWYYFNLVTTTSLVIDTQCTEDILLDTQIAIFSSTGYKIAEDDDTGVHDFSLLILDNLPPGLYYLAVTLYQATYTSPFRYYSNTQLKNGIKLNIYEKNNYPYSTSTSTTSTSTSTTSTSTSSTSTSTTTYPPTSTTTTLPPTYTLMYTWCNNFDYWGLYQNERKETYSAVIEYNSITHCGYNPHTSSTSTTTTTLPPIKPTTFWDPTVSRLSSILNYKPINKIPKFETNFIYNFAGGKLPDDIKLLLAGNITGIPYQVHNQFEQPIYNHTFTSYTQNPSDMIGQLKNYTFGVVMNEMMTVDSHNQDDVVQINNSYSFKLHSDLYAPIDISAGKIWRVRYGVLPPGGELDPYGLVKIDCNHTIKPFVRDSYVNTVVTDSRSDKNSWDNWLRNFVKDPQEFDYQFVCEFGLADQPPEIGVMIRIIHLTTPNTQSWFVNNGINDTSGQIHFLVMSGHRNNITWTSSENLGSIINGTISEKYVRASSSLSANISYKFREGTYSLLPQGLRLHRNGLIYGRCSFRTRESDNISVPENNQYTITVRAGIENYKIYSDKVFTLQLIRSSPVPGDDVFIAAYPNIDTKQDFLDFINSDKLFPSEEVYRYEDPYFGRIRNFFIKFVIGLKKTEIENYEQILKRNHFNKVIYFDQIKLAYVRDSRDNVEYEVVYATIKDLVLGKEITTRLSSGQIPRLDLMGKIFNAYDGTYRTIEPNDLLTMQSLIVDTVGHIPNYETLIDRWQTVKQPFDNENLGAPVGFIPAVPLVFAKPGFGLNIIDRLKGQNLNRFLFEFDRYQFDNYLSSNFDIISNSFTTPVKTWFDDDGTYFDGNSCQIIDGIEYVADPRTNDKYLKFGKINLFK